MIQTEQDLSIPVLAIDGPSGVGKSTSLSLVANNLNFNEFDGGILYRATTLQAIRKHISLTDEETLAFLTLSLDIIMRDGRVFLEDQDVTAQLKSKEIDNSVYFVSKLPKVRKATRIFQLKLRKFPGLVIAGRDACYVFETKHRFYLTADIEVRATRRALQLGKHADVEIIKREMLKRDEADATREVEPLRCHPEAYVIDTGKHSEEEVAAIIVERYQKTA